MLYILYLIYNLPTKIKAKKQNKKKTKNNSFITNTNS